MKESRRKITILTLLILLLLTAVGVYFLLQRDDGPELVEDPKEGDMVTKEFDLTDKDVLFELSPGINLAGAEFGIDTADYDYNYPNSSITYYTERGVKLIRLPFRWERLQPDLESDLNQEELNSITQFLDDAAANNAYVILDLHNYNRYRGELVGTGTLSVNSLTDLWKDLAEEFGEHEAVVAYGIMNEPYDTRGTWASTAQKIVDGIREIDQDTIILVAGDNWSKASTWREYNENLDISDPSDLIVYEAHVYFDSDFSGKYICSFDECNISIDVGKRTSTPFIEWLEARDNTGFVGEYGVPGDDDRWLRSMDSFLNYLDENTISSTIWAGGPDWGDYILSIEPTLDKDGNLVDKPQIGVLEKYLED